MGCDVVLQVKLADVSNVFNKNQRIILKCSGTQAHCRTFIFLQQQFHLIIATIITTFESPAPIIQPYAVIILILTQLLGYLRCLSLLGRVENNIITCKFTFIEFHNSAPTRRVVPPCEVECETSCQLPNIIAY